MSEPPVLCYQGLPLDDTAERVTAPLGFELHRAEGVGIFGPSGEGKTTLIEALARASLLGKGCTKLAYLPQNPRDLFPSQLAPEFVIQAVSREQADPRAYRDRCRAILKRLNLNPDIMIRAPLATLSGGEIQRAAVAILLAADPDILLADEPSASLDARSKAALAELLTSMRKKSGLALVVTSHDIHFVRSVCDRILTLTAGTLVQRHIDESVFAKAFLRIPTQAAPLVDIVIARHQVRASAFGRRRTILSSIRQSLHPGVIYGVTGPSGIGKSTLLRILAGHEMPTQGHVTRLPAAEVRPYCILTPQDARRFFDPMRSTGAFAELLSARTGKDLTMSGLAAILAQLELHDPSILRRKADEVSVGEAQRLAVAITLWLSPQLMCLDEIDSGVPMALKRSIGEILRKHAKDNKRIVVIVSHDLAFLSSACDQIIDLEV